MPDHSDCYSARSNIIITEVDRVLAGGGEAGGLVRSIDWSNTALGPVERWSQALRSTVALILPNRSAMLLWWGPDFIQIYNDAYRPVLGDKHPGALGQAARECWSEIWHIIGPMVDSPFRGGPASVNDDLLLPIRRKSFVEETHFRVAYSPVPDETVPGTGIGGVLATATETTEQIYAERQLRRERDARIEAEAANRAKDEFLAVVSHELRTPLTAMMGWARLLLDGGLPADRLQHGLEVIERNAQTQAQLIDDLLDVSRIITGKVRIDPRPIRPIEFIEAAIESVRLAANARGVRLQLALDPTAEDILGDRDRLQQVVCNLVSNAIEFTPPDGCVGVRLARAGSHVEICVEDTGRGIHPEFMPYVFERFRQADSSFTRALGGLGLGLAIARHMVELHGGTIDVHSDRDGHGARFTVRLPVAPARPGAAADPGASAEPGPRGRGVQPDLGGLEILVVDDEQDGRDVITEILERAHARVTVAASAAEAMDLLARYRPAVLVSDIGMPGEDGFTLMRRVRALPDHRGGRIPAIALTAYARTVDRQQAMMAGYDVHIGKPVDPTELVVVVASLAVRDAG